MDLQRLVQLHPRNPPVWILRDLERTFITYVQGPAWFYALARMCADVWV
jgi:hypothetical protein